MATEQNFAFWNSYSINLDIIQIKFEIYFMNWFNINFQRNLTCPILSGSRVISSDGILARRSFTSASLLAEWVIYGLASNASKFGLPEPENT